MKLDPRTQDVWLLPLMSNAYHLWKAGHEQSVCGLPWSIAAQSFDAQATRPANRACVYCAENTAP